MHPPPGPPRTHDDDDDDDLPCYRHPSRLTALRCVSCDRPICVDDCAIQAAVGFKCPDCARTSRAARAAVPPHRALVGGGAGAATALVLGSVHALVPVPFMGIILGYVVGIVVGEITRRASGGYRDELLARIAALSAAIGILVLPVLALISGAATFDVVSFAFVAAAAAFAAFAAHQRAS